MALRTRSAIEFDDGGAESSGLWRFLIWAGLAVVAVAAAVLSARTETGAQRLAGLAQDVAAAAVGAARPKASTAASLAARSADFEIEARRLAEALRLLAADRDRLVARLDALERNQDMTGSISRENPAPALTGPTGSSLLPAWSMVPSTISPAAGIPPMATSPAGPVGIAASRATAAGPTSPTQPGGRGPGGLAANEQAAESVATKTEFGLDLGGDQTLEGLRALWESIRGNHASLFEGLRPVVSVREGSRPGTMEMRLVAGPLSNAGTAARLCAVLSAAGLACQPTVFDGQRLALR